jgi:hypothetical protein
MNYRHGDVIIKKTNKIKGKKLNHLTLAEGEVTGHSHQITEGEAELYEHEGTLFLRVKSEKALLTHEEHEEIVLPKGDYEINKQVEYSPEGWRYVAD